MRVLILMGSPLKEGNTAALLNPYINELKENGAETTYIELYDKKILGCLDCRVCQKIIGRPGCAVKDDMQPIFESMLKADVVVFATPVFTWSFTAPLKAVLDRMFCLSKYYGSSGESNLLLKDKKFALVATCGDEIEKGTDLVEMVLKRLAEYVKANYIGMLAVRDINGISDFKTQEVIDKAKSFAVKTSGLQVI